MIRLSGFNIAFKFDLITLYVVYNAYEDRDYQGQVGLIAPNDYGGRLILRFNSAVRLA